MSFMIIYCQRRNRYHLYQAFSTIIFVTSATSDTLDLKTVSVIGIYLAHCKLDCWYSNCFTQPNHKSKSCLQFLQNMLARAAIMLT